MAMFLSASKHIHLLTQVRVVAALINIMFYSCSVSSYVITIIMIFNRVVVVVGISKFESCTRLGTVLLVTRLKRPINAGIATNKEHHTD